MSEYQVQLTVSSCHPVSVLVCIRWPKLSNATFWLAETAMFCVWNAKPVGSLSLWFVGVKSVKSPNLVRDPWFIQVRNHVFTNLGFIQQVVVPLVSWNRSLYWILNRWHSPSLATVSSGPISRSTILAYSPARLNWSQGWCYERE